MNRATKRCRFVRRHAKFLAYQKPKILLLGLFFFGFTIMLTLAEYVQDTMLDSILDINRELSSTPAEGITILSSTISETFLNNGEGDISIYRFIFMPPTGQTPDQYSIAFTCDRDLVSQSKACSTTNEVTVIANSDATALNTTVECTFAAFPGSTSCELTATQVVLIRQHSNNSIVPKTELRQSRVFKSEAITTNVYGVVFYLPDSSGRLSEDATIVSGTENSFKLDNYDRTVQEIREISIFAFIPGSSYLVGTSAETFFQSATVSTIVNDRILRYNPNVCSLTGAAFSNGVITLPDPDSCAIGIASRSDNDSPQLGVQFRAFKSGNFTLQMTWGSFGSSEEIYEQSITFSIMEPSPPVLLGVESSLIYKSTPCEIETLKIVGYNFRFATKREIVVKNEDDSLTVWSELKDSFQYDDESDISVVTFESSGGKGKNLDYIVKGVFGSDSRTAVVAEGALPVSLKVSFSSPPTITSMVPNVAKAEGGDTIVLSGKFEGFSINDFIFVGGYPIEGKDVIRNKKYSQLTFNAPPLLDVGNRFTYGVYVAVCAERSASISLTYFTPPSLSITAADSSANKEGGVIIPSGGSSTFIAEVSGNNVGVQYDWKMMSLSEKKVDTGNAVTNEQMFIVTSDMVPSQYVPYFLVATVKNSLGLTDSATKRIRLAERTAEYISVNVYPLENITRSEVTTALVQASVEIESDSLSDVVLEWTFAGKKYLVDNNTDLKRNASLNSASTRNMTTGSAKFGLEFNIGKEDMKFGAQRLILVAYLASNKELKGSDEIVIHVVPSPLLAVINDGMNGTLILSGNDLSLNGGNSSDPDRFAAEGDATGELTFEWISCARCLRSSFRSGVENCLNILPSERKVSSIKVLSKELLAARLDTDPKPLPTYFSFGLRVSKGNRSKEVFSYFDLRTVEKQESTANLSSLHVVDRVGNLLENERVSSFSDIIVQPMSTDPSVVWSYHMSFVNQQYLFTRNGTLKSGQGFVSQRGEKSRLPLGFQAGSLEPNTEYRVIVSASSPETSLVSEYEVGFTTAEVPKLSCTGPPITKGLISQTKFTVSGQLSFESQNIEYCFFLTSSPTGRFIVGKGCSSIPFATFKFPLAGTYGFECLAKTTSGVVIDNVTLSTKFEFEDPTPSLGAGEIQILAGRIANLTSEATSCKAARDHGCILSLISVAKTIANAVENATTADSSDQSLALIEDCKEYVAKISALSEELAQSTVFRPNEIENAIDLSYHLIQIPGNMIDQETTLYAALKQVENAVNATDTWPIISNEMVDKVSEIANMSMTTALKLGASGSSRRRLLQDVEITRATYASVMYMTASFIAQARAQQEECGYSGVESTRLRRSLNAPVDLSANSLPPLEIHIRVSCTGDQISSPLTAAVVKNQICSAAISSDEGQRAVSTFIIIPAASIAATGLMTDFVGKVTHYPLLEIKGIKINPPECFQVTIPFQEVQTANSTGNWTAGVIETVAMMPPSRCTPQSCYNFKENTNDLITFSTRAVTIVTSKTGMYAAGLFRMGSKPQPPSKVKGFNFGKGAGLVVGTTVGVAFLIVAVMVSWLAISSFAVSAPGEDESSDSSEYIERDMFGRGKIKGGKRDAPENEVIPHEAKSAANGPGIDGNVEHS